MNWVSLLLVPLIVQLLGYGLAASWVSGGGSFVGLLLIPLALLFTPALLIAGVIACVNLRRDAQAPIGRRLGGQWLLAVLPALVLVVLRAIEAA